MQIVSEVLSQLYVSDDSVMVGDIVDFSGDRMTVIVQGDSEKQTLNAIGESRSNMRQKAKKSRNEQFMRRNAAGRGGSDMVGTTS